MADSVINHVKELVDMVLSGRAMEAFDKFYADDVQMQENENPPTVGKDANRKREEEFFAQIKEFHGANYDVVLADANFAALRGTMEFTNIQGDRVHLDQVAIQTWKDGKIVHEKFYYNGAH